MIAASVVAVGIAEIAFAVQIRTGTVETHGPATGRQAVVTSWLASEMWVNPGVLLLGGVTLVAAAALFCLLAPRVARR